MDQRREGDTKKKWNFDNQKSWIIEVGIMDFPPTTLFSLLFPVISQKSYSCFPTTEIAFTSSRL